MSSILHFTDHRSYYLYRKETDMRKGFDSLCGIIENELGRKALSGDAFIFINRPRTHLKLLVGRWMALLLFTEDWRQGPLKCLPLTWTRIVFPSPLNSLTAY